MLTQQKHRQVSSLRDENIALKAQLVSMTAELQAAIEMHKDVDDTSNSDTSDSADDSSDSDGSDFDVSEADPPDLAERAAAHAKKNETMGQVTLRRR